MKKLLIALFTISVLFAAAYAITYYLGEKVIVIEIEEPKEGMFDDLIVDPHAKG